MLQKSGGNCEALRGAGYAQTAGESRHGLRAQANFLMEFRVQTMELEVNC